MTTVERKEHIATWDGDASRWLDYVKRVRLQYEGTEPKKRCLLGAELASRLTGKAWDITSAEVDHSRLQRADGAAYLLSFLEERFCKTPIPDVGQRLEEFFMRLRRQPGASMTEWATSLRESYRRLQRAMARQRQQNRVLHPRALHKGLTGLHLRPDEMHRPFRTSRRKVPIPEELDKTRRPRKSPMTMKAMRSFHNQSMVGPNNDGQLTNGASGGATAGREMMMTHRRNGGIKKKRPFVGRNLNLVKCRSFPKRFWDGCYSVGADFQHLPAFQF